MSSHNIYRPILGSLPCFYSSNQALNIDLSNEESKRRLFNRLLYRSRQRGFLELDLILGRWVEDHIHSMDENGIKALVHVLDLVSSFVLDFSASQPFNLTFPQMIGTLQALHHLIEIKLY